MKNFFKLFLILFTTSLFSQQTGGANYQQYQNMRFNVTGSVVDSETDELLEYATVTLKNKRNPENVFGGITGEDGKFSVEVSPGMYEISIDYISFESYTNDNLLVRGNTDLGTISLSLDISVLEEVEVRAERTQVEVRLDKKIYNVGQDITVRGGNVSDVLANIPSIDVDFDGNISLRGNNNVRILINGKPSGLVGLSGPQGLRSIPSESIEKVEVVTSPSARYSAEGTAGILNIILKKQDLLWFNGNVNGSIGSPKNSSGSGTFNLRNDKLNIFNTTTYKDSDNNGNFFSETEYFRNNLEIESSNKSTRNEKNIFLNLGLEYYFDDKTSLTLSGFYRKGDELSYSRNIVNDITNGNGVDYICDSVGKDTLINSMKSLKHHGTLAIYGSSSGNVDPNFFNRFLSEKFIIKTTLPGYINTRKKLMSCSTDFFNVIQAGIINILIDNKLNIKHVSEAHRKIENRETIGSTILEID